MVDTRLCSLVKIVETGSFTKAAEQLALSQPAVSQHIRQLEDTLGIKIFDHSHNKFRLTAEGEIVVNYARRMMALYNNLEQALKNEREQIRSLTIGITHTAESSAIIEGLAAYVSKFDGLNLKILTNTTDNLYSMLKNYELDFAFVESKSSDPSLRYIMLDTDCLVLAVSPNHPLAQHSMVTIDQLKKEKLILRLPSSNTRNLFSAALAGQNLNISDFNVIMEIDSIATIKDLIRHNLGVSVLARSTCLDELKKKKIAVRPIEHLSMEREINIVYLRDFEHQGILKDIVRSYDEVRGRIET